MIKLLIGLLLFLPGTGEIFTTSGTIETRGGGFDDWTNPGNITADDGSNARIESFGQSNYLVASGFGFNIPKNVKITSIKLRFQAARAFGLTAMRTQLQDNNSALLGSEIDQDLSGGSTMTVYTIDYGPVAANSSVINDSDFGVKLWVTTIADVTVDYVTLEITYRRTMNIH